MVMKLKHMVVYGILMVEMIAFGHMYLFGKNGLHGVHEQKKVLAQLQQTIDQLQKEVDVLASEIMEWETNDFYKEKIAREQLQMARKGDKLFYRG